LSSVRGTACFDKSPQSQSRGITLDLGFSTFRHNDHQVTIVDCPGHASLIRTVLCGAQIIDLIVLVIDGTKGIQAQTAECLIVAEIMTERLVFVVNKIDLWLEEERKGKFEVIEKKLRSAMKDGKFAKMPIVPFSATLSIGVEELKNKIHYLITEKPIIRNIDDNFVFAADHCFPVKGQGTVLTGTVLQGQISVNEVKFTC
jgi:selenocysteine-specific elongation factor